MRMTSTVRHRLTNIVARADGELTCAIDDVHGPHILMKMSNGSSIMMWFNTAEISDLQAWTADVMRYIRDKSLQRQMNNKHSGGTV
jgi:hypothetical protein